MRACHLSTFIISSSMNIHSLPLILIEWFLHGTVSSGMLKSNPTLSHSILHPVQWFGYADRVALFLHTNSSVSLILLPSLTFVNMWTCSWNIPNSSLSTQIPQSITLVQWFGYVDHVAYFSPHKFLFVSLISLSFSYFFSICGRS